MGVTGLTDQEILDGHVICIKTTSFAARLD